MATVRIQFLPEGAIYGSAAAPQYVKTNGTSWPVSGLAYDATTSEMCYWRFIAATYGSGNLTATVYWYADTASSGAVVWECAIGAITANTDSGDIETKALATATNAADTHLGTTGQRLHSQAVTISNLDSLAADDHVALRLARLPADGGDTMTGDAIVTNVMLSYSDT